MLSRISARSNRGVITGLVRSWHGCPGVFSLEKNIQVLITARMCIRVAFYDFQQPLLFDKLTVTKVGGKLHFVVRFLPHM